MHIESIRRVIAVLAIAHCMIARGTAVAAVPEPTAEAAKAVPDTARVLPPWLHLHAAIGLGWLSSPPLLREHYQAGQGYELGFETRPGDGVRLRLNGEYQVLPAYGEAQYTFISGGGGLENQGARDTLTIEQAGRGWLGSARLEAQFRLMPNLWALGGIGRGYLGAGLKAFHASDPSLAVDLDFPGSSGWAWTGTVGGCYEFDILGPLLGIEVRWTTLKRTQDNLQTWSIRFGWQGY